MVKWNLPGFKKTTLKTKHVVSAYSVMAAHLHPERYENSGLSKTGFFDSLSIHERRFCVRLTNDVIQAYEGWDKTK